VQVGLPYEYTVAPRDVNADCSLVSVALSSEAHASALSCPVVLVPDAVTTRRVPVMEPEVDLPMQVDANEEQTIEGAARAVSMEDSGRVVSKVSWRVVEILWRRARRSPRSTCHRCSTSCTSGCC
jgi:hypothetical protein